MERVFFIGCAQEVSRPERIQKACPVPRRGVAGKREGLSITRQCALLRRSRAAVYRKPSPVQKADLDLMRLIERLHLERPFYGARKIAVVLSRCGLKVGRKRLTRLMRLMGIATIYRKPNLSRRHPQHKIYPYLLRNMAIDRVHQVWSCDIT